MEFKPFFIERKAAPLKYALSKIYAGGTPDTGNELFWTDNLAGLPWVSIGDISASNGNLTETTKRITIAGQESKRLEIVPRGTLLISIFATLGKTTTLGIDATINQAILGLEPNDKLQRDFLRYYLHYLEREIDSYSSSNTQANLNLEKVRNLPIQLPPYSEQIVLARFLDEKTAKIDTLIEKKRRLIELLKEERQAVINRAVTKGLNPNAKMKPSGIEWLGDVPVGWEVRPLSTATVEIQTGPFGSQLHSHEYVENQIPVVNPSHMLNDEIREANDVTITPEKANELARHKLIPGDIVAARRGELGRCALVTERERGWLCGTGSLTIRVKRDCFVPSYLLRVFGSNGVRHTLSSFSIGSTMENLNAGMVGRLRLPCPPLSEQQLILSFLDTKTNEIAALIEKAERAISLLTEYRTALITEAVTGKVQITNHY